MAVPIPNPPTGAPDQFNPGGATTPVPDAATQISNVHQGAAPAPEAPAPEAPAPSGAALPADVQSQATPQPPAPPKIGIKEAFMRGAQEQGNPQYRATGTGEIETAEPARTWTKGGVLAAILGGAVTAAAQAASAQTPKGGTGFSAGAAQAEKSRLAADERARKIAQQNFENKQAALNDYARRQYDLAMTMHILQNNEFERDLHPGVKLAQNLENEKTEMLIREAHLQMNKDQLALVSQLGEMGIPYSTFRSIDDPAFQAQAPALRSGDVIMVPSGGRGDDNAAVIFSRADASRPLPVPFKYSLYDKGVDANGAPIPDQRIIQPGAINPTTKKPYTAVDAYDAYIEGQHQLYQLQQQYHMEMTKAQLDEARALPAETAAKTEQAKAEAGEANARIGLVRQQTKNLQSGGAKNDDGTWNMSSIPVSLVEGTMDPSQLSKRSADYDQKLQAANAYSLEKYHKPFNIAQAQIDYKFATNVQTQNTLKYLNSVIPNMANLVQQSNALGRTEYPALNKGKQWAQLETGNPQIAAYHATVIEVADQIAKILQGGGSGNGSTDMKLKQAADLFRSNFTKEQIAATANALMPLLDTRKAALIGNNRYLQQQFGVGQVQMQPSPPPGATAKVKGSDGNWYYTNGQGQNLGRAQ